MDLKKAIERVAKVCPKKKGLEHYRHIRFIPAEKNVAQLFATDGVVSSIVCLDSGFQVPNVLLEADLLIKAAKAPGASMEIEETGYGAIEIKVDGRLLYKTKAVNFEQFPYSPQLPALESYFSADWALIKRVIPAAAKETATDANLAVVHFTQEWVEATDKGWLARVEAEAPWVGLAPVRAFKNWPKGPVYACFTSSHAFFAVGSHELRIVSLSGDNFPETGKLIPPEHPGPKVLVPTEEFRDAVTQGTKVSDMGLVNLAIEPWDVIIRAWRDSQVSDAFEARVPIRRGEGKSGNVLINGKNLEKGLKGIDTPAIYLGYGGMADPLRVESGSFVACFWQMAY